MVDRPYGKGPAANALPATAAACNRNGCTAKATHLPRLMIPAKGYAIGTCPPMEVTLGLPLCEEHAKEFPIEEQALQAYLDPINAAAGKVQPDCSRAWVVPVPLDAMKH